MRNAFGPDDPLIELLNPENPMADLLNAAHPSTTIPPPRQRLDRGWRSRPCPVHGTAMEHDVGMSPATLTRRSVTEHRYRCEECDAEYVLDHSTKVLRMIDGRDL